MKKTASIHRAVTLPAFSVSALLLMATAQNSEAVITVAFEETGGDVVATISGELDLTGLTRGIDDNLGSRGVSAYTSTRLLQIGTSGDGGSFDRYSDGTHVAFTLSMAPSSHTISETFGYTGDQLYVPGATPLNASAYTPAAGMTMTWSGMSLADIGLGTLSATPITVWNNPNATGDAGAIQFVGSSVPEPSSSLLLGLAGLGFISRRKR
ncbi:PEP-CTERM sorting domain-containing protein (plasmid) [Verrucomicrobiaceae bacterium 227]